MNKYQIGLAIFASLAWIAMLICMAVEVAQQWHLGGAMAAIDAVQVFVFLSFIIAPLMALCCYGAHLVLGDL